MCPIFVEFRSATSEIGGEKKKKERKKEEETLVKYKSADIYYIGRPNKDSFVSTSFPI